MSGVVVAAVAAAAEAGAQALRAGGNAVDAAVATGFALGVVDPQNSGVGGYGGFAVVAHPDGRADAHDFSTVPARAYAELRDRSARGALVSTPMLGIGLLELHARAGRLQRGAVLAPAIALARRGHRVGPDLARALRSVSPARAPAAFRAVFFAGDAPLEEGAVLAQPELAATLEGLAVDGPRALRAGALADAICAATVAEGGALDLDDLARPLPPAAAACRLRYRDALIDVPPPDISGGEIAAAALEQLRELDGTQRDARYVAALVTALRHAWEVRDAALGVAGGHTTHLCAADADGMLVALTQTHGPLWFGSRIVVPGTGILLNAAAPVFAWPRDGGPPFARTNLLPAAVSLAGGRRMVLGTPGGTRIPAIVLQAVLDVLIDGIPLGGALARPRVSVDPQGRVECEPALAPLCARYGDPRILEAPEYYGPATGIARGAAGELVAALDPRFAAAAARA